MDLENLFTDFCLLLDKHKIDKAAIIMPRADDESSLLVCNVSVDELRQIGHLLVKTLPDERGPLN